MFSLNHLSFFLEEKPFYPIIYYGKGEIKEPYNTYSIPLACHVDSDLQWENEIKKAEDLVTKGKYIFWDLDLKIENLKFPLDNKLQFESLNLAVKKFTKDVYPLFSTNTLGVCLYSGKPPLNASVVERDHFYNADVFIDFIRLFLPSLPDQIIPFILFDSCEIKDPILFLDLFSKERFEYFCLGFTHAPLPKNLFTTSFSRDNKTLSLGYFGNSFEKKSTNMSSIGLPIVGFVFPHKDKITKTLLLKVGETLNVLEEIPLRLIYEPYLIEEIDGLDKIIVFEEGVSSMGKRQIQGFCAAGGEVIAVGDSVQGLADELSLEKFPERHRGRGIRTPDLLVPNQSR